MKAHAEIVSGAYKLENINISLADGTFSRPMTEDEKLLRKVQVMDNYITHMSECAEGFVSE